jgi:tRNA-specific 2-thiouridylase
VTLDLREDFRAVVVDPFVASYAAGETPNPCTRCNGAFRFDALLDFAGRAGAARLRTGHYARIVERDGRFLVARAVDSSKDQSYMLATVEPDLLGRVAFPLGGQTKEETRAEAVRAGLAAARRRESQEACFLAGGDYRDFLERQGLSRARGPIVDADGRALGEHEGYWRFTPGQRRGLRIAGGERLHVLRTDSAANAVVVGPRESLRSHRVEARGRLYVPIVRVQAKLRHRSPAVPAVVETTPDGFALELDEPVEAPAIGQVAALYDDDAVVGAGVVTGVS